MACAVLMMRLAVGIKNGCNVCFVLAIKVKDNCGENSSKRQDKQAKSREVDKPIPYGEEYRV